MPLEGPAHLCDSASAALPTNRVCCTRSPWTGSWASRKSLGSGGLACSMACHHQRRSPSSRRHSSRHQSSRRSGSRACVQGTATRFHFASPIAVGSCSLAAPQAPHGSLQKVQLWFLARAWPVLWATDFDSENCGWSDCRRRLGAWALAGVSAARPAAHTAAQATA